MTGDWRLHNLSLLIFHILIRHIIHLHPEVKCAQDTSWDGWRFCKDIMRWCETYGNEIRWALKNFKQSHATKPCHHFPTNDSAAALSILLVSKCLKQSLLSYLDAQLLPPEPTNQRFGAAPMGLWFFGCTRNAKYFKGSNIEIKENL